MRTLLAILIVPLLISPSAPRKAQEAELDPFELVRPLVGQWEGTSDGKFGPAQLEKSWELVLDGKFLQGRTRSVSEREVHEDLGMLSWDKAREAFVLREFHSEGYVNRYVVEIEEDGTFVFTTEAVENGFAPGLRAQTRLRFVSDDRIEESLALATGEGPFEVCVQMELERVKR